jgi:DNA-binding PucR family transcriptional regulator
VGATAVRASRGPSVGEAGPAELSALLRARREEIELAALKRVYAIADPVEVADPQYAEGLKLAVGAALDYGLTALEHSEESAPPIPSVLLAQARLAARNRVSLDTVLRRYFAGYTLLGDFLVGEAESELQAAELKRLLHTQAALFDRLVVSVTEEYERERSSRQRSPEDRRVKQVQRLLAGELTDASQLAYEIEAWHVGVVAIGKGAEAALRELAARLDRSLLIVRPGEEAVWAWLGGRRAADVARLEAILCEGSPHEVAVAIGEPGEALAGWRLTHRQAKAALPIAMRSSQALVRYADVALLASMLQDELLATTLRQRYLVPLTEERDGGEVLRETLQAYFAAGRNVSSAAAVLGVNRKTIASRLSTIEASIGRPLGSCAAELEAVLRMDELDASSAPAVP